MMMHTDEHFELPTSLSRTLKHLLVALEIDELLYLTEFYLTDTKYRKYSCLNFISAAM